MATKKEKPPVKCHLCQAEIFKKNIAWVPRAKIKGRKSVGHTIENVPFCKPCYNSQSKSFWIEWRNYTIQQDQAFRAATLKRAAKKKKRIEVFKERDKASIDARAAIIEEKEKDGNE